MNRKRIFAIFLRQLYLLRRSLGRIFGILYWPVVELFLWGVLTVYLNRVGGAGFNFITVLLGALVFWDFFMRNQHGISTAFLEDVWARNLANLFATPLTLAELLLGWIATSIFQTILSLAVMAVLAWLFLSFSIFQIGFLLIPFVAVLFVFGWSLGIATSAIILRFGPAAEVLAWSIPFLFQPLSAVFYPVDALPRLLQPIAKALPSTHIFEGMRAVLLGKPLPLENLAIAAILAVLYLAASIAIFAAVFRIAKRRGFLARFNTEGF